MSPGWTLRFVRVSFSSSSSRRGIVSTGAARFCSTRRLPVRSEEWLLKDHSWLPVCALLASRSRRARARAGADGRWGGQVRKSGRRQAPRHLLKYPGSGRRMHDTLPFDWEPARDPARNACASQFCWFLLVCTTGRAGPGLHSTTTPPRRRHVSEIERCGAAQGLQSVCGRAAEKMELRRT